MRIGRLHLGSQISLSHGRTRERCGAAKGNGIPAAYTLYVVEWIWVLWLTRVVTSSMVADGLTYNSIFAFLGATGNIGPINLETGDLSRSCDLSISRAYCLGQLKNTDACIQLHRTCRSSSRSLEKHSQDICSDTVEEVGRT